MWRRWKATDGSPSGCEWTSASDRPSVHLARSSRARSSACRTARPTAGTSVRVPCSQGSIYGADSGEVFMEKSFKQSIQSERDHLATTHGVYGRAAAAFKSFILLRAMI